MQLATIAARNVWRNKARTLLTLAGVMIAVMTFLLLRTFIWSWSASAEQGARDRIGIRHKVSFIMQLPRRYVEEVRQIPGVKQVAHASWFGAKDPNHLDDFFGTMAVEPDDFLKVYDEIKVPPEQRLSQVKVGGPCEIVLDAYPTKRFRGKAHEITPRVNRTKATVVVKVAFVDDREGVLPDMAARVSFLSSELDQAQLKQPPKTIVPSDAIATLGGVKVVYVVDDGKVRATPIELGPAFGSGFEVARGPGAGTKLVKSPPAGLADGQRIKEKGGT
jgi:hypothetical protein